MRRLAVAAIAAAILLSGLVTPAGPAITFAGDGAIDRACMRFQAGRHPGWTRHERRAACRVRASRLRSGGGGNCVPGVPCPTDTAEYNHYDIGNMVWEFRVNIRFHREWNGLYTYRLVIDSVTCPVDHAYGVVLDIGRCARTSGESTDGIPVHNAVTQWTVKFGPVLEGYYGEVSYYDDEDGGYPPDAFPNGWTLGPQWGMT